MAIVHAERLTYDYMTQGQPPVHALQDLDFAVDSGFTVVLGSTGSGKSTLLQHFNGILQPTSGKLQVLEYTFVGGAKQSGLKPLRRRVGLVFQFPEHQLFEETVERDLMFGPIQFGAKPEAAAEAAQEALAMVGLPSSVLEASPFELSGGQIRKVAIATVLASDPELLVLDEPTATLDPISRAELIRLLHGLCAQQGKAVVMVTHRLDEVFAHADRFILMKEGRIVFQGGRQELMRRPEELEAAGIEIPATLRLAALVAEKTGAPLDTLPADPAGWADWIAERLGMKAAGRAERPLDSREGD